MKRLVILTLAGIGFVLIAALGCGKPKTVPAVSTAAAVIAQCSGQQCTINLPGADGQVAVLVCPAGFTSLRFYPNERNVDGTYRQKQPLHGNSDGAVLSIRFPIGTLVCGKVK